MNAYVRERIAGAIVGVNAFQIRRDPIQVGFIDDEELKKIQRRPIIGLEDVPYVERALPDAQAISLQSGWPTPLDRKSTRLNSSHVEISYAVFCLKKKKKKKYTA